MEPLKVQDRKEIKCDGCLKKITERFLYNTIDHYWHQECLVCEDCKVDLSEARSCFTKFGRIYCKADYFRRFGSKCCGKCQQTLEPHDMIMRAKHLVFHTQCFTCSICQAILRTGDEIAIFNDRILCNKHSDFSSLEKPLLSGENPLQVFTPNEIFRNLSLSQTLQPSNKGRPRKRKPTQSDDANQFRQHREDGSVYVEGHISHSRSKRMRTSFKNNQLVQMKQYFTMNHNPDAKDLKQLSHKTGLTKRVLQVWFQNSRAKYRRNMLRDQLQSTRKSDSLSKSGDEEDDNISYDESIDLQTLDSDSLSDGSALSYSPSSSPDPNTLTEESNENIVPTNP